MVWVATAIAAVGVGIAGYSAYEQKQAGDAVEESSEIAQQRNRVEGQRAAKETLRLAEKASEQAKLTLGEQIRVKGKELAYQQSLAEARAAGSGVAKAGSVDIYLDALETAGKEEIDWMKRVGESEEARILEEGKLEAANILGSVAGGTTYDAGSAWIGTLGQGIVTGAQQIYSVYAAQSAPTTPA